MVSVSGFSFEAITASLREQSPASHAPSAVSSVFVTVNVAASVLAASVTESNSEENYSKHFQVINGVVETDADEGVVSVRTHKRSVLLDEYSRLKIIDKRQWGNMAVTLLQLGD